MSKNQPTEAESEARRQRALELRRDGKTFREIADLVGFAGPSGAHKAVTKALDDYRAGTLERAEQLATLEALRLDRLTAAIWPKAIGGDLQAVRVVLSIMERRAKLFSLDGAEKLEVYPMFEGEITTPEQARAILEATWAGR